jgi:hypothetical protein
MPTQDIRVTARRTADSPIGAALDDAAEFFAQLERERPLTKIRMPLRMFGLPFPGSLSHPVTFTFGTRTDRTQTGQQHDEIVFSWHTRTCLLPDMHGTVHLRIAPQVHTALEITGTYNPPFGLLGHIFDAAIGRRLAQRTIDDFADHITAYVEDAQRAFCCQHAT